LMLILSISVCHVQAGEDPTVLDPVLDVLTKVPDSVKDVLTKVPDSVKNVLTELTDESQKTATAAAGKIAEKGSMTEVLKNGVKNLGPQVAVAVFVWKTLEQAQTYNRKTTTLLKDISDKTKEFTVKVPCNELDKALAASSSIEDVVNAYLIISTSNRRAIGNITTVRGTVSDHKATAYWAQVRAATSTYLFSAAITFPVAGPASFAAGFGPAALAWQAYTETHQAFTSVEGELNSLENNFKFDLEEYQLNVRRWIVKQKLQNKNEPFELCNELAIQKSDCTNLKF